MKKAELRNIISKDESTRIEFKECSDRVPSSMYETVTSFSNTDGGTILLGVNNDQEITGINEEGLKYVALPSSVIDVDWKQLILHLVPSWYNIGTKLNGLKWVSGKVSTKEKIQEVPSWTQKGIKLLQKRNTYYIQILLLTSKHVSLDEMMRWIGYKNRSTFRRNYLETLESIGFVTKTIPDVPNSPDQKYQITEKGKLFLAGYNIKLG